ncbi:O-antigen polymerase [Enterococcus timonensis]|uniref:O-antigen polymerase n=1 Tax=Enterococcus timonensis TaxID=1852364 RepID=UPI001319F0F8|nr:O-antigen polymerase [Enterococcus timonensis]
MSIFESYLFTGKDIFSPSFLVSASFAVSWLFSSYNYTLWGLSDFGILTVLYIFFGLQIFILVDSFAKNIRLRKQSRSLKLESQQHRAKVYINKWAAIFSSAYQLIVLILTRRQVQAIGSLGDTDNFLYNYRIVTSFENLQTSRLVSFLSEISLAVAFVFLYIFIRNFQTSKIYEKILLILPVLILCLTNISSGSRFNIIKLFTAGFAYYMLIFVRKKVKFSFVAKSALLVVVFFGLFYLIRTFSGRLDESSAIEYLSSYLGGPIKLFDLYIRDRGVSHSIFGEETFYSINTLLIKLGILNTPMYSPHLEFRYFNGINLGNIYNGFRRSIQDFGPLGYFLVTSFTSLFYSIFYQYIKQNRDKNQIFSIMIYGAMTYPLFLYSINDYFSQGIISVNFVQFIFYMLIFSKLVIRKDDNESNWESEHV